MSTSTIIQLSHFFHTTGKTGKDLIFILTDLTGRQLRADRPNQMTEGPDAYSKDITGVQPGIYVVPVFTAATKTVNSITISL